MWTDRRLSLPRNSSRKSTSLGVSILDSSAVHLHSLYRLTRLLCACRIVRSFISSFGNVEGFDIMGRALKVVEEAQLVATDLYGEGMSPRDQQKFMFEKVININTLQ